MVTIVAYCEAMTITPDAPVETRMIDGIPLTPKQVTILGQEALAPAANVAEERLRRKQKLAGALRIFGRLGFGEGVAGHITVRDPEFPDHFWVNPLGLSFRHMRVSDLILVNHHGEVVYGKYAVNRAAYVLHAAVHTARPDVVAAAHAHSVYGKAFSSLGIQLDALTQDSCAFYENNVVISEHGGAVVFEESAGRDFAEAFGNNRAAIHQNHGHFTVGASVDEAVFWFVCFERCAQAQLAAMAAGTPKHIPHDSAVYTRENAGNAMTGWAHFQPLWQEICRTDPDLFD
jgi:ribulose-5-phosphate 4-epimerase/fuculose-1-phosphate aldolase